MIRLTFACDGAVGRERLKECDVREVVYLESYGAALLPDAVAGMKRKGWTFRHYGNTSNGVRGRFIVRCPRCEGLRVKRNEARAKRDALREARKR